MYCYLTGREVGLVQWRLGQELAGHGNWCYEEAPALAWAAAAGRKAQVAARTPARCQVARLETISGWAQLMGASLVETRQEVVAVCVVLVVEAAGDRLALLPRHQKHPKVASLRLSARRACFMRSADVTVLLCEAQESG